MLFIDRETEAFRGPSAGRCQDQDWSPRLHHGPSKHHRWHSVPWKRAGGVLGAVPWFQSRCEFSLAALRTGRVGQELKDELERATMAWKGLLEANEKVAPRL